MGDVDSFNRRAGCCHPLRLLVGLYAAQEAQLSLRAGGGCLGGATSGDRLGCFRIAGSLGCVGAFWYLILLANAPFPRDRVDVS